MIWNLTVSSLSFLTRCWSVWCGTELLNVSNSLSLITDGLPDWEPSVCNRLSDRFIFESFIIGRKLFESVLYCDIVSVLSISKCLAIVLSSLCRFNAKLNSYNRQTRIVFDVARIVTLISHLWVHWLVSSIYIYIYIYTIY